MLNMAGYSKHLKSIHQMLYTHQRPTKATENEKNQNRRKAVEVGNRKKALNSKIEKK